MNRLDMPDVDRVASLAVCARDRALQGGQRLVDQRRARLSLGPAHLLQARVFILRRSKDVGHIFLMGCQDTHGEHAAFFDDAVRG